MRATEKSWESSALSISVPFKKNILQETYLQMSYARKKYV